MSIHKPKEVPKFSISATQAYCTAAKQKIVFSFEYMTDSEEFSFSKKSIKDKDSFFAFIRKIKQLSALTWDDVLYQSKWSGGFELMRVDNLNEHFFSSLKHTTLDEKLYVCRFNSNKCRLFLRRGEKCKRVAQILACEFKLGTAYNHGS